MNDKKLLGTGLVGSVIAAVCCFTPLLVLVFAGLGLSAFVGWLDYALFPLMFASLGIVAQALWIQAGRPAPCPRNAILAAVIVLSALIIWLEFRYALRISIAAAAAVAAYWLWLRRAGRGAPGRERPHV